MLASIFVDPVRVAIFAASHLLGGSLGAGVLAVSFVLRALLLPLTLRLARRSAARAQVLAGLRPQLAELNRRHAKDPEALWRTTAELHRRAGIGTVDPAGLLGAAVQLPIFAGIYGAVRQGLGTLGGFAWIANLGRPDAALALAVAAVSGLAAWLGAHGMVESSRGIWISTVLATGISLAIFWHASSVLVLSWGASSLVSAAQAGILLRERRRRG